MIRKFFAPFRFFFLKHKFVLLLALFSLLPLIYFNGRFLYRAEEVPYINYAFLTEKYNYAWSSHFNSGGASSFLNQLLLFPVGFFYKFFEFSGLPDFFPQRIFLILVNLLTVFSINWLLKHLTRSARLAFLGTLFYTLNFYVLSTPFYTSKMFQLFLLPLFFLFVYRYLSEGRFIFVVLNFLCVFIFQSFFVNLPNALVTLAAFPIGVLFFLFTREEKDGSLKRLVRRLFVFSLSLLPTLGYVFVLYFFSVAHNKYYLELKGTNSFLASKLSLIFQLFRGAWWEPQGEYNRWKSFYDNPLIVLISFLLSIFLFLGIYIHRKNKNYQKRLIFWYSILFLSIFLSHGAGRPFGIIYETLFRRLPFFFIFREPWAKFIPLAIFSGTILLVYNLDLALGNWRKHSRPILLLFLMIILVRGYPFFTWHLFSYGGIGRGSVDALIPDYWKDLAQWSRRESNLNVLVTPIHFGSQDYYNWYESGLGNFSGYLPYFFTYFNTVTNQGLGSPIHNFLLKTYNPKVVTFLGVGAVLDQGDVYTGNERVTFSAARLAVDGILESEPVVEFGKLKLYAVKKEARLPKIFASNRLNYIQGGLETIPSMLSISEVSPFSLSYLSSLGGGRGAGPKIEETLLSQSRDLFLEAGPKSPHIDISNFLSEEGVLWPEVSVNPSSPLYSLARLKEFLIERTQRNKIDLIDKMLWHAAKRVSEIDNFEDASRAVLVNSYLEKLDKIFVLIRAVRNDERGDKYWQEVAKVLLYVRDSFDIGDSRLENFVNRYTDWLKRESDFDCQGFCYEFQVPVSGLYKIYIDKGLSGGDESIKPSFVRVDREIISPTADEDKNWFVYEDRFFEQGRKYSVTFGVSKVADLLEGEWRNGTDFDEASGTVDLKTQSIIPGFSTYEKENNGGEADLRQKFYFWKDAIKFKAIKNWRPGHRYKISFDYEKDAGEFGVVLIENFTPRDGRGFLPGLEEKRRVSYQFESGRHLFSSFLSRTNRRANNNVSLKRHFEKIVSANDQASSADLYLYVIPEVESVTSIKVQDLKVEPYWEPKLILKNQRSTTSPSLSVKLNFNEVNPTRYEISLDNPRDSFFLLFNESYHPGWRLSLVGGKLSNKENLTKFLAKPINFLYGLSFGSLAGEGNRRSQDLGRSIHFIANGFANGWLVDKDDLGRGDKTKLLLEYSPQRYFTAILGFSVFLVGLGSLYLVVWLISFSIKKLRFGQKR